MRISSDVKATISAAAASIVASTRSVRFVAAIVGGGPPAGATGLGDRDGLAAWWWAGAAGIGSATLALWVGPSIRRVAAEHDLRTAGDFLEWRYDRRVRATIAALLWVGTIA